MKSTPDYKAIANHCTQQSELSGEVIDKFLLYYAAAMEGFDHEFEERLKPYHHAADPSHIPGFTAQYIAHRIFKSGGIIRKFVNHTEVKDLPDHQLEFLNMQRQRPWRMCFSVITDSPAPDFYHMEDVLTGEPFLLYSKSTTLMNEEAPVITWLNLIGWNGQCWQTYGPITGFRSFSIDDIFYFATELNKRIETEGDIAADLDRNPVPYMMLYCGSTMPLAVHGKQSVASTGAEYELAELNADLLKKDFKLEYERGIYRFTLKRKGGTTPEPVVYFDPRKRSLFLLALSISAFQKLARKMISLGFDISDEPQYSVQISMLSTMSKLFKRDITADPYPDHFVEIRNPKVEAEMDRVNKAIKRALPEINAGRMPDVKALAKETGLDEAVLTKIFSKTLKRLKEL